MSANEILVDSHCHLNMLGADIDLDLVIKEAQASKVVIMNTICTSLKDIDSIVNLIKQPGVYGSVGIHPNNTINEYLSCNKIIDYIKDNNKLICIGETGLDYYKSRVDFEQKRLQKASFVEHILAAQQLNIPLVIHARQADQDIQDILQAEFKNSPFKAVLHSFTSGIDLARCALDLGMYISLSGIVTFKNATSLQNFARYLPLDRMLVETDSPYLCPEPYRGQINLPARVIYIAKKLAQIKNLTYQDVCVSTTNNFLHLFDNAHLNQYYESLKK